MGEIELSYYTVCGLRYRTMLYDFIHDSDWKSVKREDATKLLEDFIEDALMKLNRWLGYIHLISWGVTTVEAERDFTRPLFRTLDYA